MGTQRSLFGDGEEKPAGRRRSGVGDDSGGADLDYAPLIQAWESHRSGTRGLPRLDRYPVECRAFRLVWKACGRDADLLVRSLRAFLADRRRFVATAGWPVGIFVSQKDGYIAQAIAERQAEAERAKIKREDAAVKEPLDPSRVRSLAMELAAQLKVPEKKR
jgi:hypothetical protein